MSLLTSIAHGPDDGALPSPVGFDHLESRDQQQQLLRYAQDLQDLLAQKDGLEARHQQVLEFMGRGAQDADLLLNTLLRSVSMYLVTDQQGEIMQASPAAESALLPAGRSIYWLPLHQLMPYTERDRVASIIRDFVGAEGGIRRQRLLLCDPVQAKLSHCYEALVLRGGNAKRMEYYWLLGRRVAPDAAALPMEDAFALLGETHEALVITDSNADIRAVNPAFVRITGYAASDVVGQNPRLLSSGLQGADFYRGLWRQLHAEGSWTGELFNRRKNGQIYFEWVTIKAVIEVQRATSSYVAAFSDLSPLDDDDVGKHDSLFVYQDGLTGLPNRRLFEARLMMAIDKARHGHTELSAVWIALDRFSKLSQELGHDACDSILRDFGARLKERLRPGDTLARAGGGEFLVLLPDLGCEAAIKIMGDGLLRVVAEKFQVAKNEVHITASMGCAGFPQHATDVPTLMRHASASLYNASPFTE